MPAIKDQPDKRLQRALREKTALADTLLQREQMLLEANQKLEAIYNASSDGLTLCRAITDEQGMVIDYQVLEVY